MPEVMKLRTGQLKVNLNVAVLEDTYNKIKATAERNNTSMGSYLDFIVEKVNKKRGGKK